MDEPAVQKIKRVTIEATVIRGDSGVYGPPGSVEDLGVIADSEADERTADGNGSDERRP